MCVFGFFFFKQKTAYEMRISDWSSDVCSSYLVGPTVTKASLLQAVLPSMPDAAQAAANWQGIDLQLLFECCVDLGFEAADTAGNALDRRLAECPWLQVDPAGHRQLSQIGRASCRDRVCKYV